MWLAIAQTASAALFGGIGLWQRNHILSRPLFEGQTLWDTTARYHVWPWPLKFAFITNFPVMIAGAVVSLPIEAVSTWAPIKAIGVVDGAICVAGIFALWYWIGSRLKPSVRSMLLLALFTFLSVGSALFVPGYTGFVPYAVLLWLFAIGFLSWRRTHSRVGAVPDGTRKNEGGG